MAGGTGGGVTGQAGGMDPDQLLTPADVAALFRVHVQTIARWVRDGALECVRTPSGRPRFKAAVIREALQRRGEAS